jgi:hypothetical protein
MFKALGLVVVLYTAWAAFDGKVYAKHRWSGRHILKSEEPRYFWAVIAIYGVLGIALMTVF